MYYFAISNRALGVQFMFAYGPYKSTAVHYDADIYQCMVGVKVHYY